MNIKIVFVLSPGQYWNREVNMTEFTGELNPELDPNDPSRNFTRFVINMTRGDPPGYKAFTGVFYPLSWEFKDQPCIYAGNRQGGPIHEVLDPNDPVIEGTYRDYVVDGLFETEYVFGRFNESLCLGGVA